MRKEVLVGMLLGLLLGCVESQDDTGGEIVIMWEEEGYNCYPPWHHHCQTSGSAILRRRTDGRLVRRRPLPVWELDVPTEDRLPYPGDLQEWLSDGTWTLPRESGSDGPGNDGSAAMGQVRRQILDRLTGGKVRSLRPGKDEQH
ncbi:uncharacterized protein LOC144874456 isoform X1 [Branchiostoma floridae x Branchiostoma japonicum]